LKNGKKVAINIAEFTNAQKKEIFQYIYEINGLKPEEKLRRDLKMD